MKEFVVILHVKSTLTEKDIKEWVEELVDYEEKQLYETAVDIWTVKEIVEPRQKRN